MNLVISVGFGEKPRQFLRRSVRRRGWLLYRGVDRFLTNRDPRQEPLD